jgi:hypothetical protein
MKLGGIYVDVRGKTDKYERDLAQAKTMTGKAAIAMKQQLDMVNFAKMGVHATIVGGVVAVGIGKAIKAASDLQEVQGKFDVVFGENKAQAEGMANVLVDSYAMSTREAKQYLSSIQDLLVPMGMSADNAIRMSNEVVKLSADLASFNNMPTAKVMEDIQSGLVGNFETMKKYGVILNETVVRQKALEMGLYSGKGMVDANTKAYVAFKLMLKGSAAAIGDQKRTMGSYANQIKSLTANFEDLKATIGAKLLPQVTSWVAQLNIMIKQNPGFIDQIGSLAKAFLSLAAAMGKVAAFGIRLVDDFVKTAQAMGLASTGLITYKKALFDSSDAVKKFESEQGRLQLRIELLTEQIEEIEKRTSGSFFHFQGDLERLEALKLELKNTKIAFDELQKTGVTKIIEKNAIKDPDLPLDDKPPSVSPEELKAIEARKKLSEEVLESFKRARMTETELALYELHIQYKEYSEFVKDKIGLDAWLTEEINKIETEANRDRNDLRNYLTEQTKQATLTEYEYEKWALEQEVAAMEDRIGKDAALYDQMIVYRAEKLKEIEERHDTTSNYMIELSQHTAESMEQNFSDLFFDVMTGEFDDFKDYATAVFRSIQRAFADMAGQMVKEKLFGVQTQTGGSSGGWFNDIIKFGTTAATTYFTGPSGGAASMEAGNTIPMMDNGGISNARGIYQTGDISEAHIPLPGNGKLPVNINGKDQPVAPTEITILNAVAPDVVEGFLSSSRGRNAIINIMSSNAPMFKRVLA